MARELHKKKNQELKNQIETLEKANNQLISKLDRYDAIVDERDELKKQLEDKYSRTGTLTNEVLYEENTKLINQQKEFIKWLEDKIQQQETLIAENQEKSYFLIYEDEKGSLKLSSQKAYIRRIILEEILSKYKEIIGGKDE